MNLNEALKLFRENLDLSKKQFNNEVISDSFYYKVENGANNISADLLFSVLKENDISVSEFIHKADDGLISFVNRYIRIKELMYSKDIKGLSEYKNNKELTIGKTIIDGLIEKNKSNHVSDEIQVRLTEFLCSFNAWNEKHFLTYCLAVKLLSLDNILKLESIYSSSINNDYYKTTYQKDYYAMKISIVYQACCEKEYNVAQKYLLNLKKVLNSELYLYEKIMIDFFENYIAYREKNCKKTAYYQNCVSALSIFKIYDNMFIESLLTYLLNDAS